MTRTRCNDHPEKSCRSANLECLFVRSPLGVQTRSTTHSFPRGRKKEFHANGNADPGIFRATRHKVPAER